jgi:hypothetical protein
MAEITVADWFKIVGTSFSIAVSLCGLLWFILSLKFRSQDQAVELLDEKSKRFSMELVIAERSNLIKEMETKSKSALDLVFALTEKVSETDMKHSIHYTTLSNKTEDTTRRLENLEIHIQKIDEKISTVNNKIDVLIERGSK